jgi:hypothetical protein
MVGMARRRISVVMSNALLVLVPSRRYGRKKPEQEGFRPSALNPKLNSGKLSSRPHLRKLSCSTAHLLKCSVSQRPTGAGGIRTPVTQRVKRFSRPSPSAARPLLRITMLSAIYCSLVQKALFWADFQSFYYKRAFLQANSA